jgi:hypothetical protein
VFKSILLGVCALSAVASSVSAQVTGVITSRSASFGVNCPFGGQVGNQTAECGSGTAAQEASNYQVSANVTPTEIDFANNATTQGYKLSGSLVTPAFTTASTSINITYTNGGTKAVKPKLQSSILPGGFGFYVDNPAANPAETFYGVGDVNQAPNSNTGIFTDFTQVGAGPQVVSSFDFKILSDGVVIKEFTDSVTLEVVGNAFTVTEAGAPALNNFRLVTLPGSADAVGYQWDATRFVLSLGDALAPGDSRTLTYVSSVTTQVAIGNQPVDALHLLPQLLAYSGFADPIGRSGQDPYFARLAFGLPTFDPLTGSLAVPMLPKSLPELALQSTTPAPFVPVRNTVLGVPEPRSWMLMLGGISLLGAALRRRSAPSFV